MMQLAIVVLTTLADARLITTGEDTAEVAHEALIREWPTLRDWLADDREGLRLHRHLTEAAQDWERLNREPDSLYRGARLDQANEWAAAHLGEINALERAFLDASQALARQEEAEREAIRQHQLEAAQKLAESESRRAEEQARSAGQLRRRARYFTGAFIVALVMALAAAFFGAQARQTTLVAQNERRIATGRELAAAALNNLTTDPERSILLAMNSLSVTYTFEGEDALRQGLLNSLVRQGRITVGAAAGIRANVNRAYEAVKSPNTYNPGAYRAALGEATEKVAIGGTSIR